MHAARDIHYIICLDFKFHKFYLIWIDGEDAEDEVLVDDEFKIIAFKTEEELIYYWKKYIKENNTELTTYSIYKLQQWLLNPYAKFNEGEFLNLWNLFIDIAVSIKLEFIGNVKGDIRDSVYDKLYDASGLFNVEEPNPVFDADEIDMLSKVMQNGLDLLLDNLKIKEKILP